MKWFSSSPSPKRLYHLSSHELPDRSSFPYIVNADIYKKHIIQFEIMPRFIVQIEHLDGSHVDKESSYLQTREEVFGPLASDILKINLSLSNNDPFRNIKTNQDLSKKETNLTSLSQGIHSPSSNIDTTYDKLRKSIVILNPILCFLVFIVHLHSLYLDENIYLKSFHPHCATHHSDNYNWSVSRLKTIGCINAIDVMVTVFFFLINIINLVLMSPIERLKSRIDLSEIRYLLEPEVEAKRMDCVIELQLDLLQTCVENRMCEAKTASFLSKSKCKFLYNSKGGPNYDWVIRLLGDNQISLKRFKENLAYLKPSHFWQNSSMFKVNIKRLTYLVALTMFIVLIFSIFMAFAGFYIRCVRTGHTPTLRQCLNLALLLIYIVAQIGELSGYMTIFTIVMLSQNIHMKSSYKIVNLCLQQFRTINELNISLNSNGTSLKETSPNTKQLCYLAFDKRLYHMRYANQLLMETIVKLLVHLSEMRRCTAITSVMIAKPIIIIIYVLIPGFVCSQLEVPTASFLMTCNIFLSWSMINLYGTLCATMIRNLKRFERACLSLTSENIKRMSSLNQPIANDMTSSTWSRFMLILQDIRQDLIPMILSLRVSNELIMQFNFFTILSVMFLFGSKTGLLD